MIYQFGTKWELSSSSRAGSLAMAYTCKSFGVIYVRRRIQTDPLPGGRRSGPTIAGMIDGRCSTHAGGIAERLASVRLRIAGAAERAGRDPATVRLIAVTKTVP